MFLDNAIDPQAWFEGRAEICPVMPNVIYHFQFQTSSLVKYADGWIDAAHTVPTYTHYREVRSYTVDVAHIQWMDGQFFAPNWEWRVMYPPDKDWTLDVIERFYKVGSRLIRYTRNNLAGQDVTLEEFVSSCISFRTTAKMRQRTLYCPDCFSLIVRVKKKRAYCRDGHNCWYGETLDPHQVPFEYQVREHERPLIAKGWY